MTGESILFRVGMFHLSMAVFAAWAMRVDHRELTGVNIWLKPTKFWISAAIMLLTLAVLMQWLNTPQPRKIAMAIGFSLCMLIENVLISGQAWRGVRSHFNITNAFDGAIFGIMGVVIAVNTVLLAWMLVEFFVSPAGMPDAVLWGARLGLVLIIVASAEGYLMAGRLAHSVGVPDGGPGLPFANWSTTGGDLRVAHFLGLHGLQILSLAGWLIAKLQTPRPVLLVFAVFVIYTALTALTFLQALAGKPLWASASSTSPTSSFN
jgi:hypothetical protein